MKICGWIVIIAFLLTACQPIADTINDTKTDTTDDTINEQTAIQIVQVWRIPGSPDMTCVDMIELVSLPYVKYGDAEIEWSSTKIDNDGNYNVRVSINNSESNAIFRWKVNIITNEISPLDIETVCPPQE